MGTNIRPTISKKNPYYISKHRFYELKHYCLQYYEWKKFKKELEDILAFDKNGLGNNAIEWADPTGNIAVKIDSLNSKINQIDRLVVQADPFIQRYLFKAVTEGVSYTYLKTVMNIPCSKDYFYRRYRKFWWMLSQDLQRQL